MNFKDKIVLVTGATSGIGKEIAKELLKAGSILFINYGNNEKRMLETKEELVSYEDKVFFIKADISIEEEVIDMFNQIKQKYNKLDLLVNNAGTNIDGFIETFDMGDWRRVVDVNLTGKVICTKYAIPLLKLGTNPSVVNIASRLGTSPCTESSAYSAAEAALINFTKASALELSKYNIRVNSVSPGFTPTPLSLASWTKEEIEEKRLNNPRGRLGKTGDIANAVLFLLSDKADYINGINLDVNGGSSLIK